MRRSGGIYWTIKKRENARCLLSIAVGCEHKKRKKSRENRCTRKRTRKILIQRPLAGICSTITLTSPYDRTGQASVHLDLALYSSMIHPPAVSTPTTQPLGLQNNDHFSWNSISSTSRDTEPRALQKDNSPSVPSASMAAPFSPGKTAQNTSPNPRQSSLTPPPSSPRRDGEAELTSAPAPAPPPPPQPLPQDASPNPSTAPSQDPTIENPPPSRPLTPLSELSPVPDNDEDAPSDPPGADKGEGPSSLQPTSSSPSRQIPVNLETPSSQTRISPSRPHPTSSDHSPQRASFSAPVGAASNTKAALILGLNAELLKCGTFTYPFQCSLNRSAEYAWSSSLEPSPPMTRDINSLSFRYSKTPRQS